MEFKSFHKAIPSGILMDSEEETDGDSCGSTSNIAMKVWNNTSLEGYKDIRKTFISHNPSCNIFPTYHEMKKKRLNMTGSYLMILFLWMSGQTLMSMWMCIL